MSLGGSSSNKIKDKNSKRGMINTISVEYKDEHNNRSLINSY
jgi:hypothetical protein